jgi:GNAT superfamily N-acetyltransferase
MLSGDIANGLGIHRSKPTEAAALTELAHQAKRHWGYPDHFIALWAKDLTFDSDFITNNLVYTAFHDGTIVGVYAIAGDGPVRELEHFWVHPEYMGQGVGRQMFHHAVANTPGVGARALEIISDPHAERFYLRMGARRAGEVPSMPTGRTLPRLLFDVG